MKIGRSILPVVVLVVFLLSGCATLEKADMADLLKLELEDCQKEVRRLRQEKETHFSELESAKSELEERLRKEISEYKAKLEMTERGLVITFLSEVFFDSGKAVIKNQAEETLSQISEVLNTKVKDSLIAIEGHTDNDPIKYSRWKSNWELSAARAVSVLHYLIDKGRIQPERLSAVGYGEFHPVAPNDTPEGKQQNRRVEIVILPAQIQRVK